MKSLSFNRCLDQAFHIFNHSHCGILYVSIGSFLKKNTTMEKIRFQQAPFCSSIKKPIVVILVDPMFAGQDPVYLDRLEQYQVKAFGTQIYVSPDVTFFKCGEFIQDSNLQKLVRLIQQYPHMEFYIGDFTVIGHPFHEFPTFYKKILGLPNVWLSQSNSFVNAQKKCDL